MFSRNGNNQVILKQAMEKRRKKSIVCVGPGAPNGGKRTKVDA